MHSEGYSTWSYLCVCFLSVKSHFTSRASVYPKNTVMYSAGDGSHKVFSETALLQRSSTAPLKGIRTYGAAIFLQKARMRFIHKVVIFIQ